MSNISANNYKRTHRKQGLCVACPKPAMENSIYCAKHYWGKILADRKYKSSNREKVRLCIDNIKRKYKKEGRCVQCGAPTESKTYCPTCQEKHNSYR